MNKNINNLKSVIKERWKFYLVCYLFGYILPLIMYGIPSWQSLFPIKLMGIICAILVGNALYLGSKQVTVFFGVQKAIKYGVIVFALIAVIFVLKEIILWIFDYDIIPLLGY